MTTPTTCGALYTLHAPAISGRAVIFECDRTPGHLGPHRESIDPGYGVAFTWSEVAVESAPRRKVPACPRCGGYSAGGPDRVCAACEPFVGALAAESEPTP